MSLVHTALPTTTPLPATTAPRRVRRRAAGALLAVAVGLFPALSAAPAHAAEMQILCGPGINGWTDYSCMAGSGYHGQGVWGANWGRTGHNCTSWVSYRLQQAGLRQWASPMGNASQWDNISAGVWRVDSTPAVGSVAQWDGGSRYAPSGAGHVAMVTAVTSTTIDIVEDSYSGTDRTVRLWRSSTLMPTHFIHTEAGSAALSGAGSARATTNPAAAPARDLWFVKTAHTGSGKIELHNATAASAYATAGLHTATMFNASDAANGTFQVVGRDLWFIKTRNTGSGRVEIHIASAASGWQRATMHTTTLFSEADATNGTLVLRGHDLVLIKTKATPGTIEVHIASAASGWQHASLHSTSLFTLTDASNGTWTLSGDDLAFVKTRGTPGHVEVHIASAATGYQRASMHAATLLSASLAATTRFEMVGRDLVGVRLSGTSDGKVGVVSATAATGYQTSDVSASSLFVSGDSANGVMEMARG